jgi:hypothetical protein
MHSCTVAGFTQVYSTTLTVAYDFSISIELIFKVIKPNKKDYLVPLKVHHLACHALSIFLGVIQITLGTSHWEEKSGCDYSKTKLVK